MRSSEVVRYSIGFWAAFAMLPGCGSAPPAPPGPFLLNTAGDLPSAGVLPLHYRPSPGPSWMSRDAAKTKDLLYVSNLNSGTVNVYSYPDDKQVGTIKGDYDGPDGICVDKKQDIWVVNNLDASLFEYKHGGKTPIATLGGILFPIGCSVDPTTGDLAVTSYGGSSEGGGSVSIFAHAKGTPKVYTDSEIPHFNFCGYDPKGNLYADGTSSDEEGFFFAELPKGKNTLKNITLTGGTIYYPGMVQWDGKYVAVGDQDAGSASSGVSAIYQTTGAGGKIVHETMLDFPGTYEDVVGFWIQGSTVIGPNTVANPNQDVGFFKYPAGGKPSKILTKGFDYPQGSAISE
ncbi:MAG TPA: hypothetical protein VNU22_12745 [Candidatus Acidoferrum sp.]|jgi:hypothetical protein|nr:hypothetical protein [Candidatus Acidoferrum sp.]